jgi:hypothetical protein
VKCDFCDKKLQSNNTIGACRKHRHLSKSKVDYYREYVKNNPEKIKEIKKRHQPKATKNYLQRRKDDVNFKLVTLLRTRLNRALKKNWKVGSSIKDLGCTIEELKVHLEAQFKPGMSWSNHGEWHIDHIVPLASVNLSDREDFLKVCNYKNLQPLWARENILKSDRI